MKQVRKMIEIDESKCDGCGLCITGCHENALKIVDGKAKLVKESYCDGLGACIGECPRGALKIVEREAEPFVKQGPDAPPSKFGCPGTLAKSFAKEKETEGSETHQGEVKSELRQWPVQLHLVPESAPYWQDADLLIAADCTMAAYGDFQKDLLKGRRLIIACPKLDDKEGYLNKLTAIIKNNHIKSITVAHMEVPCCNGIIELARRAIQEAGSGIPMKTVKITIDGKKQ